MPSDRAALRAPEIVYRLRRFFRVRHVATDGLRVLGYRRDIPRHVSALLARGDYEAPERQALKALLRPHDRVVEIGSCVGLVAMTAARIVGAGNVVTFEPNPAAARVARENFQLNGLRIDLREAAVGAKTGTLSLSVGAGSWLGASALAQHDGPTHVVSVEGIANVVAAHRPSVLLIDAEGMERDIVPAIPLEGIRALMIEFHPDMIGEDGVAAIKQHLVTSGFMRTTAIEAVDVFER